MKNLRLMLLCLGVLSAVVGCRPRSSALDAAAPVSAAPAPDATRAASPAPTPVELLLNRIRDENQSLNFVRPQATSFVWYDYQGAEHPAAGAEISATVKIGEDYTALNRHMQTLADLLIREGFSRDPYNTTEIMDSLIDGDTVAVIRGACPDGGGDCRLTVRIGQLKK